MFQIKFSKEISIDAKILAAISMRSKNFTTERCNALIESLKHRNTTLLIADTLQRHNLDGDIKAARKLGNSMLSKCSMVLKSAIVIDSIELWSQYKDQNILKVIHWETWQFIKGQELQSRINFIDALEKENSEFKHSMELVAESAIQQYAPKTWRLSQDNSKIKESSINYQKEELAYMMTFSEFDVLLYPGLNQSQLFLCNNFSKKFKMPENVSFTMEMYIGNDFFNQNKKNSKSKSFSFASRQLCLLCQTYINSSEISSKEKELIITQIRDYAQSCILDSLSLPQKKLNVSDTLITAQPSISIEFFDNKRKPSTSPLITLPGRQVCLLFQSYLNDSEIHLEEKKAIVESIVEYYQDKYLNPQLSQDFHYNK